MDTYKQHTFCITTQILFFQVFFFFIIISDVCGCSTDNPHNIDDTQKKNDQSYDLKKFPDGCNPKEIGIRLTNRYLQTPHSGNHIAYPNVCTWLGAFWFTQAIKDDDLYNKLIDKFEPLFTTQKHLQPTAHHVDYNVFGSVPLEIYKRKKESR
ncbi:hypothetical protein EZS27_032637 [termite gut metagenome]|uniref:Uncharacterized protein n=1 Tax=termite gut metagenome TaxID=433724 RepID=A0A5J4Q5F3_9ZZZZ